MNSRTSKDTQAIPRIDDTLHLLAGAKYFSELDLKAGYWQVELKEGDKAKTAFQVGPLGFYECNSTGYYHRFIKGYGVIARPLNDLLVGYATNPKSKQKRKR